jgi:hypothetical protein
LTTEEVIGFRAKSLAKHTEHVEEMRARVSWEKQVRLLKYEAEHQATIKDYNFVPGNLVLVRNTQVEDSLNRKMYARYLGPMIVLRRNKGGAYILCEMDGSVWQEKVGAFWVIPYFARQKIELPYDLQNLIDISEKTLTALEVSDDSAERKLYKDRNYNFDKIKLGQSDGVDTDSGLEDSGSSSDGEEVIDTSALRKLRSHN